ncbi:hypothetical protein BAE44_0015897 [Dichanthelium oligosanthes]|uniref:KIB1-4 beta-propeller domain-containing protein n=1 Tax=Dichanthelium oligosanthes TaxID=888268 RepID=A0A1E5VDJ5_9POAL|nr:hypothetical protein BAE44_0015897 [Dichanthelium oligosanthes]
MACRLQARPPAGRVPALPPFRGPCLLYSSADHEADVATLHSLSDDRRRHVTLPGPPFRGRYVVGSSRGWLATADEQSELLLVNPVTRAQVALPPVKIMRNLSLLLAGADKTLHSYVLHYMDVAAGCRNNYRHREQEFCDPDEARFLLYMRVAFSGDPSSGYRVVVIVHHFQEQLSFARIGDNQWTWIHGEDVRYLGIFLYFNSKIN